MLVCFRANACVHSVFVLRSVCYNIIHVCHHYTCTTRPLHTLTCGGARRGKGGEVYHVTDGRDMQFKRFLEPLLKAKGIKVRFPPTPPRHEQTLTNAYHTQVDGIQNSSGGAARSVAWLAETAWKWFPLSGAPPTVPFVLDLLSQDITLNDYKARSQLGYRGKCRYEDGLREIEFEEEERRRREEMRRRRLCPTCKGSGHVYESGQPAPPLTASPSPLSRGSSGGGSGGGSSPSLVVPNGPNGPRQGGSMLSRASIATTSQARPPPLLARTGPAPMGSAPTSPRRATQAQSPGEDGGQVAGGGGSGSRGAVVIRAPVSVRSGSFSTLSAATPAAAAAAAGADVLVSSPSRDATGSGGKGMPSRWAAPPPIVVVEQPPPDQ